MPDVDLFAGVNKPADPKKLTPLEQKHLPVIDAPERVEAGQCFTVTVEVGKLLAHPNETGHFIQFIDLYAGDTYLGRVDLTAITTCPKATFCVSLGRDLGPLRAYTRCNLHGVWVAEKTVKVGA